MTYPSVLEAGPAGQPHGSRRVLEVSRALVTLADSGRTGHEVTDVRDRLVSFSVELLAVDAAGLMLADRAGQLSSVASSDQSAKEMELLQLRTGQGPGLDCFHSGSVVQAPNLNRVARRWPGLSPGRPGGGMFASVHSVPLRSRNEMLGVLNLMNRAPGPLPDADLALARALADITTIAILSERAIRGCEALTEQLQTALNSRVIIEQAKGVLAQYAGLSTTEAFEMLRGYVRARNLPLTRVARLIARRDLDPAVLTSYAMRSRTRDR